MRRRSKKTKNVSNNLQTSEEKNKYCYQVVPHDLVLEIIGRLPLKSLARFLAVSKSWETSIRSPEFMRSYPCGPSSQPRTLIACDLNYCGFSSMVKVKNRRHPSLQFFQPSSLPSSRLTCPFTYTQDRECYYHHVNGLITVGSGQEQIVVNPITGKFISLPRPRTRRQLVRRFFGYDSVSDQYKVLCMTERLFGQPEEASSQHQVYTLGAKNKSWKMIKCSIPHRPWSNGLCIDGVVYYIAMTGAGMLHPSLMRFALKSDHLDHFTILPQEIDTSISPYGRFLINYEGKVAISTRPTTFTFDVWVVNQEGGKHEWLKQISFSLEAWKGSFPYVCVQGTTHTGEFILAPMSYTDEFYVFHYNLDKNSFRKIMIQVPAVYKSKLHHKRAFLFPDYVESVRLLNEGHI